MYDSLSPTEWVPVSLPHANTWAEGFSHGAHTYVPQHGASSTAFHGLGGTTLDPSYSQTITLQQGAPSATVPTPGHQPPSQPPPLLSYGPSSGWTYATSPIPVHYSWGSQAVNPNGLPQTSSQPSINIPCPPPQPDLHSEATLCSAASYPHLLSELPLPNRRPEHGHAPTVIHQWLANEPRYDAKPPLLGQGVLASDSTPQQAFNPSQCDVETGLKPSVSAPPAEYSSNLARWAERGNTANPVFPAAASMQIANPTPFAQVATARYAAQQSLSGGGWSGNMQTEFFVNSFEPPSGNKEHEAPFSSGDMQSQSSAPTTTIGRSEAVDMAPKVSQHGDTMKYEQTSKRPMLWPPAVLGVRTGDIFVNLDTATSNSRAWLRKGSLWLPIEP